MMLRTLLAGCWCLLIGWIIASSRPARAQEETSKRTRAASEAWPAQVPGIGRTTDKAKADALGQALKTLNDHLARHATRPGFWQPDVTFVSDHVVQHPGYEGPEEEMEYEGEKLRLKTWIYPLRPLQTSTIRYQEHQARRAARAEARLAWTAAAAILGVAGCLTALVALRLGRRP